MEIAAYRNCLLAAVVAPGIYKLVSLSEQIGWTREMLVNKGVPNASGKGMRRLANFSSLDDRERYRLAQSCQGMVGVAHKGYHTLNRASARKHGRRIGDCMVKVRWTGEYGKEADFNTWETRRDWQEFRGRDRADWEIYYFAKSRGNGEIAPMMVPSSALVVSREHVQERFRSESGSGWIIYSDTEDEEGTDDDDV